MFEKQILARVAVCAMFVLIGAGAMYGVMHWPWREVAGAPAADTQLGGPVVPGVCVLSRQAVFDASAVGKAANEKYKALRLEAQNQVNTEQAKIMVDARALEAQKVSLPPAEYQTRQQELAKRLQALQLVAAADSRDLEATRQDVVVRISKEAQPIIAQVYKDKGCGLLVSRDAILAGNPAMDITVAVVAGLDAKITTIDVTRKHGDAAPNPSLARAPALTQP
jgi:Skp family chaperone for outer membrane proteins